MKKSLAIIMILSIFLNGNFTYSDIIHKPTNNHLALQSIFKDPEITKKLQNMTKELKEELAHDENSDNLILLLENLKIEKKYFKAIIYIFQTFSSHLNPLAVFEQFYDIFQILKYADKPIPFMRKPFFYIWIPFIKYKIIKNPKDLEKFNKSFKNNFFQGIPPELTNAFIRYMLPELIKFGLIKNLTKLGKFKNLFLSYLASLCYIFNKTVDKITLQNSHFLLEYVLPELIKFRITKTLDDLRNYAATLIKSGNTFGFFAKPFFIYTLPSLIKNRFITNLKDLELALKKLEKLSTRLDFSQDYFFEIVLPKIINTGKISILSDQLNSVFIYLLALAVNGIKRELIISNSIILKCIEIIENLEKKSIYFIELFKDILQKKIITDETLELFLGIAHFLQKDFPLFTSKLQRNYLLIQKTINLKICFEKLTKFLKHYSTGTLTKQFLITAMPDILGKGFEYRWGRIWSNDELENKRRMKLIRDRIIGKINIANIDKLIEIISIKNTPLNEWILTTIFNLKMENFSFLLINDVEKTLSRVDFSRLHNFITQHGPQTFIFDVDGTLTGIAPSKISFLDHSILDHSIIDRLANLLMLEKNVVFASGRSKENLTSIIQQLLVNLGKKKIPHKISRLYIAPNNGEYLYYPESIDKGSWGLVADYKPEKPANKRSVAQYFLKRGSVLAFGDQGFKGGNDREMLMIEDENFLGICVGEFAGPLAPNVILFTQMAVKATDMVLLKIFIMEITKNIKKLFPELKDDYIVSTLQLLQQIVLNPYFKTLTYKQKAIVIVSALLKNLLNTSTEKTFLKSYSDIKNMLEKFQHNHDLDQQDINDILTLLVFYHWEKTKHFITQIFDSINLGNISSPQIIAGMLGRNNLWEMLQLIQISNRPYPKELVAETKKQIEIIRSRRLWLPQTPINQTPEIIDTRTMTGLKALEILDIEEFQGFVHVKEDEDIFPSKISPLILISVSYWAQGILETPENIQSGFILSVQMFNIIARHCPDYKRKLLELLFNDETRMDLSLYLKDHLKILNRYEHMLEIPNSQQKLKRTIAKFIEKQVLSSPEFLVASPQITGIFYRLEPTEEHLSVMEILEKLLDKYKTLAQQQKIPIIIFSQHNEFFRTLTLKIVQILRNEKFTEMGLEFEQLFRMKCSA